MDDNLSAQGQSEAEIEALKKTTRISLEEALSAKPAPKKATAPLTDQSGEKKATGPITGIPTHTAPIPQTIRLKRPSTSPIVINPPDITTVPTVVKTTYAKSPTSPVEETATIIKKPISPRPLEETSRIILEVGPQASDLRQKTAPIATVSPSEPTPGPKTIRLKQPSTIVAPSQLEEKQAPPFATQAAKKSETAKIELPTGTDYLTPSTQRKTIKIKRTDRNIFTRTVTVPRPTEPKPAEPAVQPRGEAARDQKEEKAPSVPAQDEPLPVFSVLAGLAVVCLALLVYLLTAQAFGPRLILPVPSGLF